MPFCHITVSRVCSLVLSCWWQLHLYSLIVKQRNCERVHDVFQKAGNPASSYFSSGNIWKAWIQIPWWWTQGFQVMQLDRNHNCIRLFVKHVLQVRFRLPADLERGLCGVDSAWEAGVLCDVGKSHHAVVVRYQDDVDIRQVEQVSLVGKKEDHLNPETADQANKMSNKCGTITICDLSFHLSAKFAKTIDISCHAVSIHLLRYSNPRQGCSESGAYPKGLGAQGGRHSGWGTNPSQGTLTNPLTQ